MGTGGTAQGSLLEESGDADGARRSYSAALAADPTYQAAWVNRAVLSYSQGELADAVADLGSAIELDDNAFLRTNRAIALQDMGDHSAALIDLDLAVDELDGDDPELWFRRGTSRLALGDAAGAWTDWQEHLRRLDGEPSDHLAAIDQLRAQVGA